MTLISWPFRNAAAASRRHLRSGVIAFALMALGPGAAWADDLQDANALLKKGEQHPIEKTGTRLRSLMPWIKKKNLKGAQAAY